MSNASVPSFPARGLTVPITRNLVAIKRNIQESARRLPDAPPPAFVRDLARHLEHLAHTLTTLSEMAAVNDEALPNLTVRIRKIATMGVDPADPQPLNAVLEEVVGFCAAHSDAFRKTASREKARIIEDYQTRVGMTRVLLLHGEDAADKATSVAKSLHEGCYYDVTLLSLKAKEPPRPHNLRALLASVPEELRLPVSRWSPDVVLSDVGSPRRGFNSALGRSLTHLDRTRVSVLFSPFSTARLLGSFEEARLRTMAESRAESPSEEAARAPISA
jgi:hypothetical protein